MLMLNPRPLKAANVLVNCMYRTRNAYFRVVVFVYLLLFFCLFVFCFANRLFDEKGHTDYLTTTYV